MLKWMTKSKTQKIILAIVVIILFNFISPMYTVQADVGGVLAKPFVTFFGTFAGGVLALLDIAMTGDNLFVKFQDPVYRNMTDKEIESDPVTKPVDDATVIYMGKEKEISGDYNIPYVRYSPEEIFAGKVAALDVNFLNNPTDAELKDKLGGKDRSSVRMLRDTIAKWYVTLRNLAIVVLLSILIYVGIRMMLCSISSEKAKYKQMLYDWAVALCLIFIMHYIMAFTMNIVEAFTDMVSSSMGSITVRVVDEVGEDGKPVERQRYSR